MNDFNINRSITANGGRGSLIRQDQPKHVERDEQGIPIDPDYHKAPPSPSPPRRLSDSPPQRTR